MYILKYCEELEKQEFFNGIDIYIYFNKIDILKIGHDEFMIGLISENVIIANFVLNGLNCNIFKDCIGYDIELIKGK